MKTKLFIKKLGTRIELYHDQVWIQTSCSCSELYLQWKQLKIIFFSLFSKFVIQFQKICHEKYVLGRLRRLELGPNRGSNVELQISSSLTKLKNISLESQYLLYIGEVEMWNLSFPAYIALELEEIRFLQQSKIYIERHKQCSWKWFMRLFLKLGRGCQCHKVEIKVKM